MDYVERERLNRRKNIKIYGSLTIFAVILSSVFFGWFLLFSNVDANHYGIKYNTLQPFVYEDQVYENGRYFVPFSMFIQFPSTFIPMDFNEDSVNGRLEARSSDGLDVSFRINIQYQIPKENVIPLYKRFGTDYHDALVQVARGTLRTIASEYSAIEYFTNTSDIEQAFEEGLSPAFTSEKVVLHLFQIKGTKLPQAFESALESVQVAQQEIEVALYEQQVATIRAKTLIIEAEAQFSIALIEANATAQSDILRAQGTAKSLNITLTAEGLAFMQLMADTGWNTTELLTYLWIKAIMEHDSSLLIIGADTPILVTTDTQP